STAGIRQIVGRFGIAFAQAVASASTWVEFGNDPRAGGEISVEQADAELTELLPDHDHCISFNAWSRRNGHEPRRTTEYRIGVFGLNGTPCTLFDGATIAAAVELVREHVCAQVQRAPAV